MYNLYTHTHTVQVVNFVFFFCATVYLFLPSFWLTIFIVIYEGLLGGTVYVNAFYAILKEVQNWISYMRLLVFFVLFFFWGGGHILVTSSALTSTYCIDNYLEPLSLTSFNSCNWRHQSPPSNIVTQERIRTITRVRVSYAFLSDSI